MVKHYQLKRINDIKAPCSPTPVIQVLKRVNKHTVRSQRPAWAREFTLDYEKLTLVTSQVLNRASI